MRYLAPAILAAIASAATPALADKLPLPKAAYTADIVFSNKGRETTGKIVVDGPKERRETKNAAGQPITLLIRRDRGRVYDLKPARKLAVAKKIAAAEAAGDTGAPAADIDSFYGAEATPEGTETIAGLQTTKYAIELKESAGDLTINATVWTTDDGIVVRIIGKTSVDADYPPARVELKNIVKGPQDAALFEVPAGMEILSTDGEGDTPLPAAPASAATVPAAVVAPATTVPAAPAAVPPPEKKP